MLRNHFNSSLPVETNSKDWTLFGNPWNKYSEYVQVHSFFSWLKYLKMFSVFPCQSEGYDSLYGGNSNISSVQFSRSVMSDSLQPHESQHARPPCPSPTPGVYSNSCSSSWWCHPAISSSVVPFSSCPQSLPASESFPMSQLFTWDGQSIGVSASASVLSMNTQDDLL